MQALAAVATLLSFAPHGNRVDLQLDRGAAEIVWLSNSTFHYRRSLEGPLPSAPARNPDPVPLQVDDVPGAVRITSPFLEVTIQKRGVLVRVRKVDGTPLMADVSEPRAAGPGVTWERQMAAGAHYYGLGPRTDTEFDLRGKSATAEVPFLISTAGYGEFHAGSGAFRFDFTAADRYRVEAPRVDYYFYYGPPVKEVFKERSSAGPSLGRWQVPVAPAASWSGLRDSLLRMVHAAMSVILEPSFDLAPYAAAPADVRQRARQLGSLVATVTPGTVPLSDFRKQLDSFYAAYVPEVEYHGYPIWHPLPFQFPDDPECARHADEFMLGDEMLIAPIADATGKRSLYLPQGVWTNLETNEVVPGRRTISVSTPALPVFARNGTIVPLDSAAGIALHYFPKLGAEFFLLEGDLGEYSQVHAAPAVDVMRLEIESKKDRDYQWVVHHVEKPASVGFEAMQYAEAQSVAAMSDRSWFYDAASKNLHVRVRVKAGEDCIVNF